jgi:hypothetical protein
MELGADIHSGDARFLFTPTLGVQLGSLIGWDNFTFPRWISIPLQMLLPMKASVSYNIIPGAPDKLTWQIEADLLY